MKGQRSVRKEKSFWSTIPGVLTGIAVIITSIGGLIAILLQLNISFWSTIPGVLTGIAAIITSIGGLIAILLQLNIISSDTGQSKEGKPPVSESTGQSKEGKPPVSKSTGQSREGKSTGQSSAVPREISELIQEQLLKNVQKQNKLPQTIPEWLDISEIIKHYEVILNEKFGDIDDPDKRTVLIKVSLYGIAAYEYRQILMEKGESNKLYKYKMFKAEHAFRAYGDYTNELGQKCRRYRYTRPNLSDLFGSEDYETLMTDGKMCKIEGRWEESSG